MVRGALNVLIVVIAFRLLHAGGGWVGFLSGAVGAGTLLGGFASMTLAGRRLALPFGVGLLLWGIPIALIAATPHRVTALLLLAIVGIGNAVEDVTGETLGGGPRTLCVLTFTPLVQCGTDAADRVVKIEFAP